ncbi:MAG: carbon storage regulator [candidate division FCPU426 bacterium]
MLGDDIEIQVLEVNGEQVRLGIQAPAALRILRRELYADVQEKNLEAAIKSSPQALTAHLRKHPEEPKA